MSLKHLPALFYALTLPAIAISISASQLFFSLATLSHITLIFVRTTGFSFIEKYLLFFRDGRKIFLSGAGIYLAMLPGTLLYSRLEELPGSELADGLFVPGGLLFFFYIRLIQNSDECQDKKALKLIWLGFYLFLATLLLSGIVSLFTEFRLSRYFTGAGLTFSAANRPQHPLIPGILYRPVAFMNTRLTYSALLLLALPFYYGMLRKNRQVWLWLPAFLAGAGLILASGGRSAGGALLLLTSTLILLWLYRLPARRSFRVFAALLGLLSVIFSSANFRHTDAFRAVSWSGSFEIFLDHFWTGAGPGNFAQKFTAYKLFLIMQLPDSWYTLNNTPAGHAHSDLLHFLSIGGFFSGACYLALFFQLARKILTGQFLYAGGLGLFFAGLFQCYMLDDEVAILFWILPGLITMHNSDQNNQRPRETS